MRANILKVEIMLKNLLTILSFAVLATGCSSLRPSVSRQQAQGSATPAQTDKGEIKFINAISIKPQAGQGQVNRANHSMETPAAFKTREAGSDGNAYASSSTTIEKYSDIQFKFAILENSSVEDLNNQKLLDFMEYWYGTPYHYGGETRQGIDCSAFAFLLMSSVYGVAGLPRMARDQYAASRRIRRDELQEGDLVFFHTLGKKKAVTHVGVYLRNNKFIHASLSGVMISDMNDGYYDKHFIAAGRVRDQAPGSPGVTLTVNP
jgi:cell wall-associated NlpC family hydrolase